MEKWTHHLQHQHVLEYPTSKFSRRQLDISCFITIIELEAHLLILKFMSMLCRLTACVLSHMPLYSDYMPIMTLSTVIDDWNLPLNFLLWTSNLPSHDIIIISSNIWCTTTTIPCLTPSLFMIHARCECLIQLFYLIDTLHFSWACRIVVQRFVWFLIHSKIPNLPR